MRAATIDGAGAETAGRGEPSARTSDAASCFICGGPLLDAGIDYRRCAACGHERLRREAGTGIVINDALDETKLKRADGLVRAQVALATGLASSQGPLVDIGCGSGRFLFHAAGRFPNRLGIEVSPESAAFGRNVFGLDVRDELPADLPEPAVVTFWHSIEHIPPAAIRDILDGLHRAAGTETRIVISVPNAASMQHRWFARGYAYYDVPAHLHQFTPRSLDRLMQDHGFERAGRKTMANYIGFGWVQGLINLFVVPPNYLYYRLKRGWDFGLSPRRRRLLDLLSLLLVAPVLPVAALLTAIEFALPDRQGVLTAWYRKSPSNSSSRSTTKASASTSS